MTRATARRARWLATGALITGCGLWNLAPPPPAWVESWYSRGLYPRLANLLVPAVDLAPFSVSIVAIAAIALLIPTGIIASRRRAKREGAAPLRQLLRPVGALFQVGVAGYFLFLVLWGAGYRRERLDGILGLGGAEPVKEDVERWVAALTARIHRDLPAVESRDPRRALDSLRESLACTVRAWTGLTPALPGRVKRLPAGWLLAFGSTGIATPFLEIHVDGAEPEPIFLAIATHELAHVAGFCAEADADLAAAVAGFKASDPYGRYAVALHLFQKFARELPLRDIGAAYDALPQAAREDLRRSDEAFRKHHRPAFARLQSRVYDGFLRSQGVKSGTKEYSFIVRQLVRAERRGLVSLLGS